MKSLCVCIISTVLLASCNLYKPGRANVPVLEGKNDGNLSVSLGRNYGVEAAYSPLNHLGIIANYTNGFQNVERRNEGSSNSSIVNTYNNQQYEFGLGYYLRIDTLHYFEIYAGYGIGESGIVGTSNDLFLRTQVSLEAMHEHIFIQPTFAYEINKTTSVRFSAKLAAITFYDINNSPYYPQSKDYFFRKTFTSAQPTMTLLKKEDIFDFTWQIGFYISPEDGFYTNRWLNTSISFGININRLRKAVKSNK